MGKAAVGLAIGATVGLAGIGTYWEQILKAVGPTNGSEDEDIALFTHADNQLHCMDRELRHPCVKELRAFLEQREDEAVKSTAMKCIQDVLVQSNDYWVLKNMTHLLLDLDTNDHVFDITGRGNEFVMMGIEYAKKLIEHEECLQDFDDKGDLECRCVPLYGKVSTLKYKNAGKVEEARELFEKLRKLEWKGQKRQYPAGKAIGWDHFMHTPQIWIPGLRSQPVWPRELWSQLPICSKLEDNFATIREEVEKSLSPGNEDLFKDAYRFLYAEGEWSRILLYHGRKFTEECETAFPKTCALLKQWLPSKPGLPWTSDQNEQVLILKMKVGTDTETHCGPANNILNIHLGISGLEGAKLFIANETYGWEEGKVIAWDGSYDHRVHCLDCKEDRVIMMVRYMHPDMSPEHYKGQLKTHFEDVPVEMQ